MEVDLGKKRGRSRFAVLSSEFKETVTVLWVPRQGEGQDVIVYCT